MLDIMTAFWRTGYAEHHGHHFDFERSGMFPVPTQPIPVVIGGHSDIAARRAARFDGYMPMRRLDDDTRREFAVIEELRAARGMTDAYQRIVPWFDKDPEAVEKAAEEDGLTGVMVMPWRMNAGLSLSQKHAAAASFARQMLDHA